MFSREYDVVVVGGALDQGMQPLGSASLSALSQ
jgi:hypothetical protein